MQVSASSHIRDGYWRRTGSIVQGRYDVVCPPKTAWDLHKALPDSKLYMIPDAGHSAKVRSCTYSNITHWLITIDLGTRHTKKVDRDMWRVPEPLSTGAPGTRRIFFEQILAQANSLICGTYDLLSQSWTTLGKNSYLSFLRSGVPRVFSSSCVLLSHWFSYISSYAMISLYIISKHSKRRIG